jgi:hypothetical protein
MKIWDKLQFSVVKLPLQFDISHIISQNLRFRENLSESHPSTISGCGLQLESDPASLFDGGSEYWPARWYCLVWRWWVVASCFCGRPPSFSPIYSLQSSSPSPTKHTQVLTHTHTHTGTHTVTPLPADPWICNTRWGWVYCLLIFNLIGHWWTILVHWKGLFSNWWVWPISWY